MMLAVMSAVVMTTAMTATTVVAVVATVAVAGTTRTVNTTLGAMPADTVFLVLALPV